MCLWQEFIAIEDDVAVKGCGLSGGRPREGGVGAGTRDALPFYRKACSTRRTQLTDILKKQENSSDPGARGDTSTRRRLPSGQLQFGDGADARSARASRRVDSTVLITGESGSGKERLARFIHGTNRHGRRASSSRSLRRRFPRTLLESELFGHAPRLFTGASQDRAGLFERELAARCSLTNRRLSRRPCRSTGSASCKNARCGESVRTGADHQRCSVLAATTTSIICSRLCMARVRRIFYYPEGRGITVPSCGQRA